MSQHRTTGKEKKINGVIKRRERKPPHPLYFAFCNAKSAAIEIARAIAGECASPSDDVRRFLEEFDKKAA